MGSKRAEALPNYRIDTCHVWRKVSSLTVDQHRLAQHTLKRAQQLFDGVRLGEKDAEAEFVGFGGLA